MDTPLTTVQRRRTKLQKAVVALILFVCVWAIRSVYTQPIEAGGDAIKKWTYVSNFFDPSTNTLANHHTMRWSVNLPGVVLKGVFGDKPAVYFLLPLTAFSAGFVFLCAVAWRVLPLPIVAAFAVLLFLEPMMHRASSQFQPIAIGFGYLSASLWFVLKWGRERQITSLSLSALCLFLAYGAKATYGYFMPGMLLFIWGSGKFRDALIFVMVFSLLFNIEVLVFNLISERTLPLGRLSAILSTHDPKTGFNHSNYIEYFSMWRRISRFDQVVSIIAIVPFIFFVARHETTKIPAELLLLCLCLVSYHLLNTFMVVDFDSMMTPQPPEQKYLAITMPFACLASVFWIYYLAREWRTPKLCSILIVASAAFVICHLFFGCQPTYWHNGIRYPSRNATLFRVNEHYREGVDSGLKFSHFGGLAEGGRWGLIAVG